MASAEREPITGVWGRSPSGVQGAERTVGVRGGKAECLFVFPCPKEAANLPHY